jgi:hypothetical protein
MRHVRGEFFVLVGNGGGRGCLRRVLHGPSIFVCRSHQTALWCTRFFSCLAPREPHFFQFEIATSNERRRARDDTRSRTLKNLPIGVS